MIKRIQDIQPGELAPASHVLRGLGVGRTDYPPVNSVLRLDSTRDEPYILLTLRSEEAIAVPGRKNSYQFGCNMIVLTPDYLIDVQPGEAVQETDQEEIDR